MSELPHVDLIQATMRDLQLRRWDRISIADIERLTEYVAGLGKRVSELETENARLRLSLAVVEVSERIPPEYAYEGE